MPSEEDRSAAAFLREYNALEREIQALSKALKLACRRLDDAAAVFTRASRGEHPHELSAIEYPTADELRTQLRELSRARERFRDLRRQRRDF